MEIVLSSDNVSVQPERRTSGLRRHQLNLVPVLQYHTVQQYHTSGNVSIEPRRDHGRKRKSREEEDTRIGNQKYTRTNVVVVRGSVGSLGETISISKRQRVSETVCYLQSLADTVSGVVGNLCEDGENSMDLDGDGDVELDGEEENIRKISQVEGEIELREKDGINVVRQKSKELHDKIRVHEDKEGRKKLALPANVLEAVYEENWDKVSCFLSKQTDLIPPLREDKLDRVLAITEKLRDQVRGNVDIDRTVGVESSGSECEQECKKCIEDDHCKLWKGPFRQAKGRHYAIRSFPKLKLTNESVMRLLLCWKYPEAARRVGLMSSSFRRVISNTCGMTTCVNEKHCKIKGIFENGQFLVKKSGN